MQFPERNATEYRLIHGVKLIPDRLVYELSSVALFNFIGFPSCVLYPPFFLSLPFPHYFSLLHFFNSTILAPVSSIFLAVSLYCLMAHGPLLPALQAPATPRSSDRALTNRESDKQTRNACDRSGFIQSASHVRQL